jgi:hypothetical protein
MKIFEKMAAQGDLLIRKIEQLPENLTAIQPDNGYHVVAHSETGHNHAIVDKPNVTLFSGGDPMISYLQVVESCDATETILEHFRTTDTHESLLIPPGFYEIRRQREYTPQGWRRVED